MQKSWASTLYCFKAKPARAEMLARIDLDEDHYGQRLLKIYIRSGWELEDKYV